MKEIFRKGKKPDEQDFGHLIDSTLNILDDGFSKNPETGMGLAPLLEKGTVLSVFKEMSDAKPQWEFAINQEKSLEIRRFEETGSVPADLKDRRFRRNNRKRERSRFRRNGQDGSPRRLAVQG